MSTDQNDVKTKAIEPKIRAQQAPVRFVQVQYIFPFFLDSNPQHNLEFARYWAEKKVDDNTKHTLQESYFHPFVSKAIFPNAEQINTSPEDGVRHYVRRADDNAAPTRLTFETQFITTKKSNNTDEIESSFMKAFLKDIELICVRTSSANNDTLALAIVNIRLNISKNLMLSHVQDFLDRSRRIFGRYEIVSETDPTKKTPGDYFSSIEVESGNKVKKFSCDSEFDYFGWIKELVSPLALEKDQRDEQTLNDERAFVSSYIELANRKTTNGQFCTVSNLSEGEFYRLSELDSSGASEFAYDKDYLKKIHENRFYNRHLSPSMPALMIISDRHFCYMTTENWFSKKHARHHFNDYYRHFQRLAVIQIASILNYSRRLSQLVNDQRNAKDPTTFLDELSQIRSDFLEFTHLFHFSNISSQIQPHEIYEMMYQNMGIAELFSEVEAEIRSASDYAAVVRAESLNQFIAFGVPLTIAVGMAGMNLFTLSSAPDFSLWELDIASWCFQIGQMALFFFISFGLFWLLCGLGALQIQRKSRQTLAMVTVISFVVMIFTWIPQFACAY